MPVPSTDADSEKRSRHLGAMLLFLSALLVYGTHIVHSYEPHTYALYDASWQVHTVVSLAEDWDLDLKNQLDSKPYRAADQTAQGKDGEWYPLHEFLMPLLTVPFYLVFGIDGCLFFNYLMSSLLLVVLYYICCSFMLPAFAFTAAALCGFTTIFYDYSYSYALDVFAASLLALSFLLAVEKRFSWVGIVWALAVVGRVANVVTFPAFFVYVILLSGSCTDPGRRSVSGRSLLGFFVGILPVAICFLVSNWLMWGNPLDTAYDHWVVYEEGRLVFASHAAVFSRPLVEGTAHVLFDLQQGFFAGAPLMLPAVLLGLPVMWWRERREVVFLVLFVIPLVLLCASYYGFPGKIGNRYLLPAVAVFSLPLGKALEVVLGWGEKSSD